MLSAWYLLLDSVLTRSTIQDNAGGKDFTAFYSKVLFKIVAGWCLKELSRMHSGVAECIHTAPQPQLSSLHKDKGCNFPAGSLIGDESGRV